MPAQPQASTTALMRAVVDSDSRGTRARARELGARQSRSSAASEKKGLANPAPGRAPRKPPPLRDERDTLRIFTIAAAGRQQRRTLDVTPIPSEEPSRSEPRLPRVGASRRERSRRLHDLDPPLDRILRANKLAPGHRIADEPLVRVEACSWFSRPTTPPARRHSLARSLALAPIAR